MGLAPEREGAGSNPLIEVRDAGSSNPAKGRGDRRAVARVKGSGKPTD